MCQAGILMWVAGADNADLRLLCNPSMTATLACHMTSLQLEVDPSTDIHAQQFSSFCCLTGLKCLSLFSDFDDPGYIDITDNLSALSGLQSLKVHSRPHGSALAHIPPSITQLQRLTSVSLGRVTMHLDVASALANLRDLELSCQAVAFLPSMQGLGHLQSLSLNHAIIGGCLHALKDLTSLVRLSICRSEFEGELAFIALQEVLTHLTQLTELNIEDWLSFSSSLIFDLSCLNNLSQLKMLHLSDLSLRGHMPPYGLIHLEQMDISAMDGMHCVATASSWTSLSCLTWLRLNSCSDTFHVSEPLTHLCKAMPSLRYLQFRPRTWSEQSLPHLDAILALYKCADPVCSHLTSLILASHRRTYGIFHY